VDFEGAFDAKAFTLRGTVGPIWAWVEPGYSWPAKLTAEADGATAKIDGQIRDPLNLKDLAFNVSADGPSFARIAKLAGLSSAPEFGAFKLAATLSDSEPRVYTIGNLNIGLGKNEISGNVVLNLAGQMPFLMAELVSPEFEWGPARLNLHLIGPFEKPAIKKIDLKLGSAELAEIHVNGTVADLVGFQGADIDVQAGGKDLANLKQLTGQPLPIRGAFSVGGKILIPVRKNLKIPDLKIVIGKTNIGGRLNLDLRGEKPQLEAEFTSPQLDLPSVLLPQLAKEEWAKGLGLVRPVRLSVKAAGFYPETALEQIDLRAGTLDSAELLLTGSIDRVVPPHGIDLNFSLQGKDLAKLKEIFAQPFLFAPLPGQGAYALSGNIKDAAASHFEVSDLKFVLADTEITGVMDFNLGAQPPASAVELSAPKFNLKPFPIPKEAAYARLNKIDNLGPLKIYSKVIVAENRLSLQHLDLRAGTAQLAAVAVKGSIRDLTVQSGIDLDFDIRGSEIANLSKITGQSLPLGGPFALSGKLTDPEQRNYRVSNLAFKLGRNDITGRLDLNLSGEQLRLSTQLAAPKFSLQPVTHKSLETLSRIEDLGPLKLALNITGAGKTLAVDNLDFRLGRRDLIEVSLQGTIGDLPAVQAMNLTFSASGSDLANFKKMGGPTIAFQGAFDVSGRLVDHGPDVYRIPSFNAVWGDNSQSGWLELDLSGRRPFIKGELASEKIDLQPLFAKESVPGSTGIKPVASVSPEDKSRPSKSDVPAEKVFPSGPLPLAQLQTFDADLKLQGRQILLPALALDDLIADILLKDGNLQIRPFKFSIGGGKADFRVNLRAQDKPAGLTTALEIDQLEIGPMLDQLGYPRSIEGNMDAAYNLASTGDSIAALMAGLNGDIYVAMSGGKAESKYLELLGKYFGSGITRMLNPFQEKRQFAPVNCLVNAIKIEAGKADIKILLDTDQTSIFGAGFIDLKTERLDLGIKPTPKKGAGPADVSFSLRELSKPFRLGGTLAHPQLAIDTGRTAFVIGKLAGALALGPVGIAAFFANVSLGKEDPCAVALEHAMKKDRPSDAKPSGDAAAKPDAGDEKKNEKKPRGFFERLFGK
jgi:uncharacterized protein involved in outer membrane biogenesis